MAFYGFIAQKLQQRGATQKHNKTKTYVKPLQMENERLYIGPGGGVMLAAFALPPQPFLPTDISITKK